VTASNGANGDHGGFLDGKFIKVKQSLKLTCQTGRGANVCFVPDAVRWGQSFFSLFHAKIILTPSSGSKSSAPASHNGAAGFLAAITVRLNISLPEGLLRDIDEHATDAFDPLRLSRASGIEGDGTLNTSAGKSIRKMLRPCLLI
jgi:hypothetical protein